MVYEIIFLNIAFKASCFFTKINFVCHKDNNMEHPVSIEIDLLSMLEIVCEKSLVTIVSRRVASFIKWA